MFNRFRRTLYGPSGSSDDDEDDDYKDSFSSKFRSALTRSVSFREDLTSNSSRSRNASLSNGRTIPEDNNNNTGTTPSSANATTAGTALADNGQQQQHDKGLSSRGETNYVREEDLNSRLQMRAGVVRSGKLGDIKPSKFRYTRPDFLQLRTDDEIMVSADHQIRPIILPRDVTRLPWKSGYAECINAGKSPLNEDQAACHQDVLVRQSALLRDPLSTNIRDQIPWTYFGLFDGHAGTAVAIAAAAQLHTLIGDKLSQIADLLVALEFEVDDNGECSSSSDDELSECCDDSQVSDGGDDQTERSKEPKDEKEDDEDDDEDELETSTMDDDFKDCASSPTTKTVKSLIEEQLKEEDKSKVETVEQSDEKEPNSSVEEETSLDGLKLVENDASSLACDTKGQQEATIATKTPQLSQVNKTNIEEQEVAKESAKVGRHKSVDRSRRKRAVASERRRRRLQQQCRENPYLASMASITNWDQITVDTLITGTLESAFWEMDALIARDKRTYNMAGGCTALASVFILGKLYVCNAGDSRAIVYKNQRVVPMSFDFTPTSERKRILRLGQQRPELMGKEFTHLEFLQRPTRKDLGEQMLYRDAYMTGWSTKTITYNDLRFPLIYGEGKRGRVLATIGVTRGFGDHELRSQYGLVPIKPFLTPEPEVRLLDLEHDEQLTLEDVLIMGTDGLWDVTQNKEAARILKRSFDLFSDNEESRAKYRYITAAQDLVIHARGHTNSWNNVWRMSDLGAASLDDISAFVVPLKPHRDEYLEWRRLRSEAPPIPSKAASTQHQ